MKNSEIAWCDNTFNPWEGCTKVSEGCKNCYALARDERFTGGIHWGKGAPSVEPMLEPVDILAPPVGIHQVIVGGESGPKARPFKSEWADSILHQCRSAGIRFFCKQLGQHEFPKTFRDFDTFPKSLQVREFPV